MLKSLAVSLVATTLAAGAAFAAQPAATNTMAAPAVTSNQAAPAVTPAKPEAPVVATAKPNTKSVRHHTARIAKPAASKTLKSST